MLCVDASVFICKCDSGAERGTQEWCECVRPVGEAVGTELSASALRTRGARQWSLCSPFLLPLRLLRGTCLRERHLPSQPRLGHSHTFRGDGVQGLQHGLSSLTDPVGVLTPCLTSCLTLSKYLKLLNHSFLSCKMEMMMMMMI